jgi:hypothetical protein
MTTGNGEQDATRHGHVCALMMPAVTTRRASIPSVSLFHWPKAANSRQKLPKAANRGYRLSHHCIYWQLLAAIGRMAPKAANSLPIACQ